MPGKTYRIEIVTPEQMVYSGDVTAARLPGSEGYFGVLANHAPLVAALTEGTLRLTDPKDRVFEIPMSGGFFEVDQNSAIVLADSAEVPEGLAEEEEEPFIPSLD